VNLPTAILTVRWLVYDTFRQSLASRLFWVMLVASGVCIAVCFSVGIEGGLAPKTTDEPREYLPPSEAAREAARAKPGVPQDQLDVTGGKLTLGFGLIKDIPLARDRSDPVRFLQVWLAGFVADTAGILLALIWTAGFLPTFLEPAAVSVLLAKPVPRWSLLAGKYLGVLAFVLFQAVVFVGGTWLALGVRTGVWEPAYLLCVPMLLIHFAVFFSFSALLAVVTRNAAACVIGTLFFWMVCWGLNYGRHAAALGFGGEALTPVGSWVLEAGYWLLPKPWDLNALVFRGIEADNFFGRLIELDRLADRGAFHPALSVLASLGFAVAALALAGYEFETTDY
jgi:hypothetical protein